ncbi:MAG: PAS domain-containing protein [Aromatoleum sp.]|jgi:PAS domain S-box-containing protein|uniref:hybrid sensor histidine kinase/response regulator n=1 Tax=Aromatoleum sp. TaxID=2307007 RepID=UPI002893E52C|nr:PAS domain-containing protein [Aromatoleum sp.]MDT3671159.1 PAS domain-containing protein [Aromatoleum sp.]
MDSTVSLPSPTSLPQGAWSTRLANTSKYASWFVAALALTAFAGWIAGIPMLASLGPGLPPATFSSIVKLLLIAIALRRLEAADERRNRYAIFFLAFVIATISVLTLLLQLETWTGLENRVFERIPVFAPAPNPVGTATCYILVALALTLAAVDDARVRGFARLLAIAAGSVALVAIVGLTFRFVRLSVVIPTVGIALPVALGMLAASVSLIVSRPSPRLLRLLEHDSPGAVIFRRLLPLVVAVPLLAGWVQALGLRLGWFAVGESEGVIAVGMIVGCAALILWTAGKLDEMNVDRSMAELRANTQQQWLEVTLANIGDAVIAVDDEVRVGFLNPAAAQLLGVDVAGAIGRNLRDLMQLVDERTYETIESPFRKAFHDLRPVTLDGEPAVRLADGSLCGIEASATPIRAASGGLVGGVLVLRDVSARRARAHAERQAFQALDRRVGERTRALERTMTVLRESTTLLRTIAASTPELIVAKSREGRIMMVNPAAVQAMGLSRAQVLGQKEQELFEDTEELRRTLENDRRVIETRRPIAVEETRMTKAGLRTYLVTKSPLRDSQGQVFGLVGVAKDITDRKRAQRELEDLLVAEHRLRGEAERANRAKDEFLAIVSHELRSPLNALKGWSQVLLSIGNPDPALVARAADAIKRNIDHQTRLIDDLLDTSRIISGKLELDNRPVDLVEVVRAAIELLRDGAAAKGVELEFAAECATAVVNGDSDRLQQIVINLVSNAIKFTLEGGKVVIRLARPDDTVLLSVSDDGVGIEADFLPHVFDRFSQADTSVTRRYLGLGIGLALVRNLVELHGGMVRAESGGSGTGSVFTVEFPAAQMEADDRADDDRHGKDAKPAVPRDLDGVRALLVDDDPDAREVMRLILTQAGASVREFDSGEGVAATLRMLHEDGDTPDVLLLDIAMPTESGFDVLKRLRGDPALPFVPAVAVTALAHLDRGKFAVEGFQGCVGKPVDAHLLVGTIRGILEVAENERTAAAPFA